MWTIKKFKTAADQAYWIAANAHRYQITPLFVNNGYAVEYKKLRKLSLDATIWAAKLGIKE